MEADWEFEIGGDAPVLDAYWPGFVNVRDEPWRVAEVAETWELQGLAAALLKLNEIGSPVWTSKTDVFVPEQVDADELDAGEDEAKCALACYIDVLKRNPQVWSALAGAEHDCRRLCARLREAPLRCCRVDVVIRRARVAQVDGLGATIYLTACGRTAAEAKERLGECLAAFAGLMVVEF
jgi:hypothetical protein